MNEITCLNDFIKRMRDRFPASLKEESVYKTWSEDCVDYLYNQKVDYAKLYKIAVTENPEKSESFVPGMKWLKEQLGRCYKKEEKKNCGDWLHVKVLDPRTKTVRNLECFPKDTTQAQILNFYENTFDCAGWEILEVFS